MDDVTRLAEATKVRAQLPIHELASADQIQATIIDLWKEAGLPADPAAHAYAVFIVLAIMEARIPAWTNDPETIRTMAHGIDEIRLALCDVVP